MKSLVVYYSRTGTTKKVGEEIAKVLGSDSDEILDQKKRKGVWGWLKAGWDAKRGKLTEIKVQETPEEFDLIVIGTPIWGGKMTPAVRTYLANHDLTDNQVAFFTTQMGDKPVEAIMEMKEMVAESQLSGSLAIQQDDVQNNKYEGKLTNFLEGLKQ